MVAYKTHAILQTFLFIFYKIYYLYEVDVFGVVTIYKIHCVKNIIKTIETFIYNREIIQEMMSCMVNNNL